MLNRNDARGDEKTYRSMRRLPSEWIAGIPTEVAIRSALVRVARISARGISIATAKTSVNAGRHRKTYRQEPGHKGALEVRLRKLAIDGGKTLQGGRRVCVPAELPGVV